MGGQCPSYRAELDQGAGRRRLTAAERTNVNDLVALGNQPKLLDSSERFMMEFGNPLGYLKCALARQVSAHLHYLFSGCWHSCCAAHRYRLAVQRTTLTFCAVSLWAGSLYTRQRAVVVPLGRWFRFF